MDNEKTIANLILRLLKENYPEELQMLAEDKRLSFFQYILQENAEQLIEQNLDLLVDASLFELESMEANDELPEENTTGEIVRSAKKGELSLDDYEMIEEIER